MKIRNFTALSLLGICCFLLPIPITVASIDEHKAAVNSDIDLLKSVIILSPGKVIAYAHNEHTNEALRTRGVRMLAFEGKYLADSLGGPYCLTMPLVRKPKPN